MLLSGIYTDSGLVQQVICTSLTIINAWYLFDNSVLGLIWQIEFSSRRFAEPL